MSPPVPPSDKSGLPTASAEAESLPDVKMCDQTNQGLQFDIHGDTTGKPMVPIPVSTPQPPQKAPKERDGKITLDIVIYTNFILCIIINFRFNSKDFSIHYS